VVEPDLAELDLIIICLLYTSAPLARLEAQIALGALLRRFDRLELSGEELVWRQNLGLRGLEALPLSYEPAS